MAGQQKINKWGGKRSGAGRPAYMLSSNQIKTMLRKARKRAREQGRSIDDLLLDIIYGQGLKVTVRDQLAAIRMFKEFTMTKKSDQNTNVSRHVGPVIGLPPIRGEDPALKVMAGGNNKNRHAGNPIKVS